MPEFMAPGCEEEREIEYEDLPDHACDEVIYYCEECGTEMKLGWHAEVEVRSVIVEYGDTVGA